MISEILGLAKSNFVNIFRGLIAVLEALATQPQIFSIDLSGNDLDVNILIT